MTTCSINDTAGNGRHIHTTVELLWEDDKPFATRPFRVDTLVDGTRMAFSHHETNKEAKDTADRMHRAYLRTHKEKGTQ